MNSRLLKILISALLILSALAWSDEDEQKRLQQQLNTLRNEVAALQTRKLEKAEALEKKEAARWQERYRQNLVTKENQEKARSLESRYSRRATDLSRVNEELVQARTSSRDLEETFEERQSILEGFYVQVNQAVEEAASNLSSDIPLNIEQRTLTLAQAGEAISSKNPRPVKAIDGFFADKEMRLNMTQEQKLHNANSIVGANAEIPVKRLTLGSVFSAEKERSGSRVQALLRTGSLQGKVFEWRSDLSPEFKQWVDQAIQAATAGKTEVMIPLDVLQNKTLRNAATNTEEVGVKERIQEWFRTGGVVMYPLMFVALLALLLAAQKYVVLIRRGKHNPDVVRKVHQLVSDGKIAEARELVANRKTSVSNALQSILNYADEDRAAAERALKEVLLREMPLLEARLGLISALGSSAPLLGLLGTVSGMITLFKIITEMGTNDARILAGGISEALVTTQTGLVVAIPVMLLHGFLSERLDRIQSNLSTESMALLNRIWPETRKKAITAGNGEAEDTSGETA